MYSDLLINTCTIQRFNLDGGTDSYGKPTGTWDDVPALTDILCRWSTPVNREVKVGAEVVIADLQLFLGDVVVTEQDRVILNTLTYEILSIVPRQDSSGDHHKELMIRTVK